MMKRLVIEKTLGISAEEVLARKHDLWVGVSNTGWFEEHVERLVLWALAHTKTKLLVLVPGRLWAVNLNHVDNKSRARALRLAFAKEAQYIKRIRDALPADAVSQVRIVGYDEVLTAGYVHWRELFYRAFSEEGPFYDRVMDITRDYLVSRGRTIDKDRLEAAALYQLQELPMFLGPLQTIGDGASYAVNVYPGLGKFDALVRDIIDGGVLPDVNAGFGITCDPSGVVSVMLTEEE